MIRLLSQIYAGRHVLTTMVVKDVKSRYAGSIFGPLWIIVPPLYQMFLYTFLFSMILKVRFEEGSGTSSFVVYLLAGLIPWIFFSEATMRGVSTFIENAQIIKKVKFPLEICVASVIATSAITFFVYMVFYTAILIFMGLLTVPTYALFLLPFIIQVLLIAGITFGLGSIAVFFRDVTQIVGMALNLVFFLTPIVYPSNVIPGKLRWLFDINPFYSIVEMYRSVLVKGELPGAFSIIYPSTIAVVVFLAGYFIFNRTREAFRDIL